MTLKVFESSPPLKSWVLCVCVCVLRLGAVLPIVSVCMDLSVVPACMLAHWHVSLCIHSMVQLVCVIFPLQLCNPFIYVCMV